MLSLLYKHSRRKKRTIAEAIVGYRWVPDIAHSLTEDLLHEYFLLWDSVNSSGFNSKDAHEDEIT